MLTYPNLSQRFFRFSPRLFSLISKHFPPLSKGSFEPLLEDPCLFPKRFCLSLKTFPPFPRLSKAHFQERPSRFPKHFCLILKTFLPIPKGFTSSFQKPHKPFSKDLQPLFRGFQAFFQRLPALFRASRSLFLAFSPYSLHRRGRFCGSGSGPRRSGRRRRVRSMLCCNCHSFILASWPESRMSGTFQPL